VVGTKSGKHKREEAVCSTKDNSPMKARFFAVRKEIYNRYKEKQQTEHQSDSTALKRVMSERERESEVIEIDNDITSPTDRRHRQRHHHHVEFASGRTWTCAQESLSMRCKLCVSTTVRKVEPLLSCTICAWVWTSCTVSRLTVSRNLDKLYSEPIDGLPCSWHGGIRFTHLCTVIASSWTKHSVECNMTIRRGRTFSKSWRLFLK
jgi:hypothetical protein